MATNGKAATSNVNGSVSVQDLSEQVDTLKADISALTRTLTEYTKSKGATAAATAQLKAHEVADAGMETALNAQKHTEEFIRTQPATVLGIAAGAGFLIGLFASRR